MNPSRDEPDQPADENEIIAQRRQKLVSLREQGREFHNDLPRTAGSAVGGRRPPAPDSKIYPRLGLANGGSDPDDTVWSTCTA